MLQILTKRLKRRDEGVAEGEGGFTLIELMVVVLIIAILLAIAIPTFLGARKRAQDRAAQSNIRNALTAEKTYYTDNQLYTADATTLKGIESSLTYGGDVAPSVVGTVYVAVNAAADTVTIGAKSAAGDCFYLRDVAIGSTAGTTYAKGTCAAPSGVAVADAKW